jgi:hypothetical protein
MRYIILVLILSTYAFSAKVSLQEKDYSSFYLKVYEADSLLEVKAYNKSFLLLDSLFQIEVPQCFSEIDAYLLYIKTAFLSKNYSTDDLKNKIIQGVSQYGLNKEITKKDSLWQAIFEEVPVANDEYEEA